MENLENIKSNSQKKQKYRWLRRTLRVLLGILLFLFLIILFVRSSWGQHIIVNEAVNYVSNRTHTKVAIDKLFITFDGDLRLDHLYLEDKKGDTLVYSKSLEANIPLWKIINGEAVGVDALDWDGLRVNVIRKDSISGYNFQFLIDAFVPAKTTSVAIDTSSTPLPLLIGKLNFSAIDIVFNDAVTGIDSRFQIGKLEANMETIDIENMIFGASHIKISDSKIKFIQKQIASDNDASAVPLPKFSSESVTLQNVDINYESQSNQIIADLNITEFYTEIPQINLADKDININIIRLKDSKVLIQTETKNNSIAQTVEQTKDIANPDNQTFEWPQLKINIAEIDLENNQISYHIGKAKPKKGFLNPNAIALKNLTLKAQHIILKDEQSGLKIDQLKFNEISGLDLKQLVVNFKATDQEMRLDGLLFRLNNNALSGAARLDYNSLSQLINTPEISKVDVNLQAFSLSLSELFKFKPELKNNENLNTLSKKQLTGNLNASGTLALINLSETQINWGTKTQISANGTLQNITSPNIMEFDILQFYVKTKRSDIVQFIDEKDLGINLPNDVKLSGSFSGNPQDISAKAKLTTTQGIATFDGSIKNSITIAYDASITIDDYKVSELLNNPQFGVLSLNIKSKGNGKTINTLDATLEATVSKFKLNNYHIKDLKIKGNIKNGTGKVLSKYKDENLNINLDAFVVLDSIAPEATVELDLIGANLQALGLMERNIKTGMKIFADFKGNSKNYDISAIIDEGVIVYDNRAYLLGDFNTLVHVEKDTTSISIKNKIIDLNLKSNSDPQTFSKALKEHVLSYFYRDEIIPDTSNTSVNLKLEGKIAQSPLLNDVFLVNVKDLDTISFAINFNENEHQLKANITAPHINYSGNELDSLAFSMNTTKENFNFNLGFKNITAGPLNIPKTVITGSQTNNELSLNFLGYHKGEKLMNVNTKITGDRERLKFTVNSDSLILNNSTWSIPATNAIILVDKDLEFNDFKISKDNQSIEITNQLANITKPHVALDFNNFKISEFFSYLNPEVKLVTGELNGNFILEDLFINTGLLADLSIKKLNVLKTDLGTLSVNGNSLGATNYAFIAALKGGDIDFDLVGDYTVENNKANIDLDFDINEFKMRALNTLSMGEIKSANGSFNGEFKVTGTTKNPLYKGFLNFNDASVIVSKLNTKFTMQNETLNVDNDGFSTTDFTILDEKNNALVLSGEIGTKNFLNPTFNINLKAKNFQGLKATKEDNNIFYGKATFNANAKLTGDLQIPKLSAELTLGSDTDITYVMPSSYANIEERDGVVAFVNRENPDAILTQTEEQTVTIKGFDIETLMKIGKDAAVTVVIDEQTGDHFRASGEGELIFTMVPNGRITLTGSYEISDGHYELNLYNLVNRKFLIAPGSRVTWSGDPFDAKLDVQAIYNLETSASALMAPQISGADPSVKNKYKQVLPFNVYLNIDGELLSPKISFELDMPEEEQGAIGGQVYGRVQQVNAQEGELNRQVFSLLVLNRFYPDAGSDGSSGGFATMARDNLNDAVSGQLNAFSDELLGTSGIALDFGLNSYTDYQGESTKERTQLDVTAQKKLFDDRLIVRVGSEVDIQGNSANGESTPLIGNVSLEYIVSKDGRYRLKGFRKSEFENVIDGQTIVSGIALIFTQEFNQFDELWDAIFKSQNEKKAKLEAEQKTAEEKLKAKEEDTDQSISQKKN
ncbi:translocation/assembly module TamB [Psychroserpens burtonensis]|uniref:Translocation/assembly module TamB n=1 Tax=Psychroserpens burtonensis TaxID=49278 RepID=A0A5C7BA15_9FLAO|nr:translocation/assembly module TamB domain-containing protein [Psychroserpens burtonensis]TXE19296.1 translocation/assembly module TamB [Psychroserpens burtonensis]